MKFQQFHLPLITIVVKIKIITLQNIYIRRIEISLNRKRMKRKKKKEKTSYGKRKLKVQNFEKRERNRDGRKRRKRKKKREITVGIFVHHGRKKLDVVQSTSKLRFHPNRRLPRN